MMYRQIECPTCGNVTTAKSVFEPQECRWCRRLFKVSIERRNSNGKKPKFDWSAESVDFEDNTCISRIRTMNDYNNEDIYGR